MTKGYKTGGRKKGTPNKATAQIKELAAEYAPEAMRRLAQLMRQKKNDPAAFSAAKEIVDRHAGKTTQSLTIRKIGSWDDLDDDELAALARE